MSGVQRLVAAESPFKEVDNQDLMEERMGDQIKSDEEKVNKGK
jgi:hypothetical protein